MEALQALKLSARNNTLNLTEQLLDGFYPLEDNISEVCEALEAVCEVERESPA